MNLSDEFHLASYHLKRNHSFVRPDWLQWDALGVGKISPCETVFPSWSSLTSLASDVDAAVASHEQRLRAAIPENYTDFVPQHGIVWDMDLVTNKPRGIKLTSRAFVRQKP